LKPAARRILLLLPLLLAMLFAGAWLLLDAWLESAGGRQAVERALQDRIGLPVRLQGEFSVMLLPSIGVSGTELLVGDAGSAGEVATAGEYAVSLALLPLLERRFVIRSVTFAAGSLYLARWPGSGPDATGGSAELPEIERLEIRDLRIFSAGPTDAPYLLRELSIERFAPDRASPVHVESADLGSWAGALTWQPGRAALGLEVVGSGPWPGRIDLRIVALMDVASGTLAGDWVEGTADREAPPTARLSLDWKSAPGGLRLEGIRLVADPLLVEGKGCLLTETSTELHLDLVAERVDVDTLPDLSAFAGSAEPAPTAPDSASGLDVNLRLRAAEWLAGGAVARQAELQLGDVPDCSGLRASATD
jgi:hypothetical protein